MAQVSKLDTSSVTTSIAYVDSVMVLSGKARRDGKEPREFFVVKLAVHNGKRKETGKLAYLYPECAVSDDLKELAQSLKDRLDSDPKARIVAKVAIANLRAQPWFDKGKKGVNYRGTLREFALVEEADAE